MFPAIGCAHCFTIPVQPIIGLRTKNIFPLIPKRSRIIFETFVDDKHEGEYSTYYDIMARTWYCKHYSDEVVEDWFITKANNIYISTFGDIFYHNIMDLPELIIFNYEDKSCVPHVLYTLKQRYPKDEKRLKKIMIFAISRVHDDIDWYRVKTILLNDNLTKHDLQHQLRACGLRRLNPKIMDIMPHFNDLTL